MPPLRTVATTLPAALPLTRLRTGALASLKSRGLGLRTRPSSSSAAMPRKKLIAEKNTGDVAEKCVGIEAIRSDPKVLDTMLLKDMKELTRRVGISTKGNKKDLALALKSFVLREENDKEGMGSLMDGSGIPRAKRKANSSSVEDSPQDMTIDAEVSKSKQKRTRKKQQSVEATTVDEDAMAVMLQEELSVETEEVVDTKRSRTTERVSTKIQSETRAVGQVDMPSEPWMMLSHKKPQVGWVPYNPRVMRPPPLTRDTQFLKLMSWNVNGLRALLKLESFSALELAQKEDFDVLCLQETKIQEKDVQDIKERLIEGYDNSFWTCSVSKLGYSGTAIISRIKPISVRYGLGIPDHDNEGRLVTVEFDAFYLLSGYVPNSGDGLRRLAYRVEEWDRSLSNYMKDLEKSKPVILTGDLNCAHQEIDIYNPAGNRRSAGFTNEERESFEMNFLSKGFVDTFRKQHPGVVGYTYWGYRHGGRKTNKGWRLDYFLTSESIADKVYDSYILPDIIGSDHCPIGLVLKL